MLEWIQHLWANASWVSIIVSGILIAAMFALSYVAVSVVLVKLPADYFHPDYTYRMLPNSHPILRTIGIGLKNLLGIVLILSGIVLSFPGVPGPGLLTIFIGVMLTDIPGKRRVEAKLISRPSILSGINKLRQRYKKPPFLLE